MTSTHPRLGIANGAPSEPISLGTANLLSFFIACSFVGSLYLSQRTRLGLRGPVDTARSRDHPHVIRARLIATSVSTLLSMLLVGHYAGKAYPSMATYQIATTLFGFGSPTHWKTFLTAPVLYLGPLYARYLYDALPGQQRFSFEKDVLSLFQGRISWRNYWIAPLTEELAFRSCILAAYRLAQPYPGRGKLIFLSPMLFGLAHVHHAYENWHAAGRTRAAAARVGAITLFQLAYTTLFGAHCAFLFLRTGSVWPAVASHIWCNIWGLPQLATELTLFPHHKRSLWTVYVAGILAYTYAMTFWTRPGESVFWPKAVPTMFDVDRTSDVLERRD